MNADTENVKARLISSSGDLVDLQLLRTNRPRELKSVPIRHILPVHPSNEDVATNSTAKQYVVFIEGSLKGQARLLHKVEGDRVWVKHPDNGELDEHSKYDFVLSREINSGRKGKGHGKGKGKRKES
jgi:hypothetical protein